MTDLKTVVFCWDGDTMAPHPRFIPLCHRQYVVGQQYRLVEEGERSSATHGHYFAVLTRAWENLPEHLAPHFPTVDSLRFWCLIKAGYCTENKVACSNDLNAEHLGHILRRLAPHTLATVSDGVVTIYTPMSQSYRAMDKRTFAESKSAVLEICAEMIGVTVDELTKNSPVAPLAGDAEPSPAVKASGEGEAA